jgi:hypothetical protein
MVAGVFGVALCLAFGATLAVPAVALVALVYFGHQLVAALAGDEEVAYPALAFVIVVNCLVVLLVEAVVLVRGTG